MFYVVRFNGHIYVHKNKEISFIKIVKAFGKIIDFHFSQFSYIIYLVRENVICFHLTFYFSSKSLSFSLIFKTPIQEYQENRIRNLSFLKKIKLISFPIHQNSFVLTVFQTKRKKYSISPLKIDFFLSTKENWIKYKVIRMQIQQKRS